MLLLFKFEKKYWETNNIKCEFIGHPLLEEDDSSKIDLSQFIDKNKAIISIFPGSRKSEINTLMPILLDSIKLINKKYSDLKYIFHAIKSQKKLVNDFLISTDINNCEIISDEKIKKYILKKSVFAIAKSGTVSLEISNNKVPSIIIYKMNVINYFIIKMLVKIKYANIINIAADKMIIPELLQSKCNPKNIYETVSSYLDNPDKMNAQVKNTETILDNFKTKNLPSNLAAEYLRKLISQ